MSSMSFQDSNIWILRGRWLLPLAALACCLCSCRSPQTVATARQNKVSVSAEEENGIASRYVVPSPAPTVETNLAPKMEVYASSAVENVALPGEPAGVVQVAHNSSAPPQYASLPPQAFRGYTPSPTPWRPPGISGTWPRDEYLHDGGDKNRGVLIDGDWTVRGLDQEDTVAHFDTIDGRTIVRASNRVQIYAPRFAAVRKITGISQYHQNDQLDGIARPTHLARQDEVRVPSTVLQPQQLLGKSGIKGPNIFRDQLPNLDLNNAQAVNAFDGGFKPFEDLQIIKRGVYDSAEKARLANSIDAALAWSHNQSAQIYVDGKQVNDVHSSTRPQETVHNERPPGTPELRIEKVASRRYAKPGDIIDFTIRIDNLGDETIGNVTVIDNLTPRLEYVPDSAQSTLKADFFTKANEGESLLLRWEIVDPIPATKGGIIRFKCRVR